MPTISMFLGIIITMYRKNEHNPPHFHAEYGEYKAAFDFEGDIVEGQFPPKQRKIVTAWAVIHQDELSALWKMAQKGEELPKIPPLM